MTAGNSTPGAGKNVSKNLCCDIEDLPEERRIGDEAKAAMKQLKADELVTLV